MTTLLLSITIFLAVGFAFVLSALVTGWLIRPKVPSAMKQSIYECGEEVEELEAVQFDLRFYVVALFFLIFDVEVALLWPVAVVFREQAEVLLAIAGVFMGLIVAGFAYEWYSGSLDWIRATSASVRPHVPAVRSSPLAPGLGAASGGNGGMMGGGLAAAAANGSGRRGANGQVAAAGLKPAAPRRIPEPGLAVQLSPPTAAAAAGGGGGGDGGGSMPTG